MHRHADPGRETAAIVPQSRSPTRTLAGVASVFLEDGGGRVHFHAGRRRGLALVWTVVAGCCGLFAGWLWIGGHFAGLAPGLAGVLGLHFLVVAFVGAALALYQWGNSLDVEVGPGRVRVIRRLFGLALSDRNFESRRLRRLRIDGAPGAMGRSALLTEFGITATLANGEEVVLADSFADRGSAVQLAQLLSGWLGVGRGAVRRVLIR